MTSKWRQKCSPLQIIEPLTEITWKKLHVDYSEKLKWIRHNKNTSKKGKRTTTTPDNKIIFSIFTFFIFSINFRSLNIYTHFVASENFSKETLGVCKICLSKKTGIKKVPSQNEMSSKLYGCRWRAQIRRAMKTVRSNRDQAKGSSSPAVEFA